MFISGKSVGCSRDASISEHVGNVGRMLDDLRHVLFGFQDDERSLARLCHRCEANLDALRLATEDAIRIAQAAAEDEAEAAGVAALLLAEWEMDQPVSARKAVTLLRDDSAGTGSAVWWSLRFAGARHLEPYLRTLAGREPTWDFASAAALDILAFHRLPVRVGIGGPPDEEDDDIAWLLAEAGGRTRGAWNATHLNQFLAHASPRVREAALRASARCGLPELPAFCREAILDSTPLEAIGFLGVVGTAEDLPRLQSVAGTSTEPAAAEAAVKGLGRLGLPAAVPFLLEFLDHSELSGCAAAAVERITGREVPRGAPPGPPPGLTEDELDFWEPEAPPDAGAAASWWRGMEPEFDPSKRYQAGLCVSDDPLGTVFDQLPLGCRHDVYLRERALVSGTPDWELETWPRKQRNPGAD